MKPGDLVRTMTTREYYPHVTPLWDLDNNIIAGLPGNTLALVIYVESRPQFGDDMVLLLTLGTYGWARQDEFVVVP
jgi:hypothetical protein